MGGKSKKQDIQILSMGSGPEHTRYTDSAEQRTSSAFHTIESSLLLCRQQDASTSSPNTVFNSLCLQIVLEQAVKLWQDDSRPDALVGLQMMTESSRACEARESIAIL